MGPVRCTIQSMMESLQLVLEHATSKKEIILLFFPDALLEFID